MFPCNAHWKGVSSGSMNEEGLSGMPWLMTLDLDGWEDRGSVIAGLDSSNTVYGLFLVANKHENLTGFDCSIAQTNWMFLLSVWLNVSFCLTYRRDESRIDDMTFVSSHCVTLGSCAGPTNTRRERFSSQRVKAIYEDTQNPPLTFENPPTHKSDNSRLLQ